MGREKVSLRPYASDACSLLGSLIRQERISRRWSQAELARRVGCSVPTVSAVEHGAAAPSIGTVFNCCAVLGIKLFNADDGKLQYLADAERRITALIPQRAPRASEPNNDF